MGGRGDFPPANPEKGWGQKSVKSILMKPLDARAIDRPTCTSGSLRGLVMRTGCRSLLIDWEIDFVESRERYRPKTFERHGRWIE